MSELPPEVQRLEEAMREFERELAAVGGDPGPGQWPPLVPALRDALHRVRDLRKQLGPDPYRWPHRACPACRGEGVIYSSNPEEEPEWLIKDPCRPCLTTGLVLRAIS